MEYLYIAFIFTSCPCNLSFLVYVWLKHGLHFGVLSAASVSIRLINHTILRTEMTVATAVQVFPDIDGETMHFSAYNMCGDILCKIAIDASEPAKSLVLKVLECMGGCVRERRQARDGANYDFDEFVQWYTIDLAVKRWAEAPVSVRKKEQKITLLFYGSQVVTPRLLACPLWSFPREVQNTRESEFKITCLWGAITNALGTKFRRATAYVLRLTRENRDACVTSLLSFQCTYAGAPRLASGALLQPDCKGTVVLFRRFRKDSYYCTFDGIVGVIIVPLEFISWARFCAFDLDDGDEVLYVGPPRTGRHFHAPFFLEPGTKGTAIAEAPSQPSDLRVRFPRAGTVALLDDEVRFHAVLDD